MRTPLVVPVALVALPLGLSLVGCASAQTAQPPPSSHVRAGTVAAAPDPAPEPPRAAPPPPPVEPATAQTDAPPKDQGEPVLDEEPSGPVAAAGSLRVGPVHFGFDSARLERPARESLDELARHLAEHPELQVTVEGHCDERGTEEYNLALGQQRAEAIRTYLIDQGVDEERIRALSYGETDPVVEGRGEEVWSLNRRGELRLGEPGERTAARAVPES